MYNNYYHQNCMLHPVQSATIPCANENCSNYICYNCSNSPLNGYCAECSKKYIRRNILGFIIGGCIGAVFTVAMWISLAANSSANHSLSGSRTAAYIFAPLIYVFMGAGWYCGACLWAKIGDVKRGFALPPGINYMYGTWLVSYYLKRFIYYLLFVNLPLIIGPFVSIYVIVRIIKIRQYLNSLSYPC